MTEQSILIVPDDRIIGKIYQIREMKVMFDMDLAELYGVETKLLKRAVRRNIKRFPPDFMFELSDKEFANLRSHFGTSSWGGVRYAPMAFTEHGIAMLSSILNSDRAMQVNIQIIRIFSRMSRMLLDHKDLVEKIRQIEEKLIDHDDKILLIFEYLKQLEQLKEEKIKFDERNKIGYRTNP